MGGTFPSVRQERLGILVDVGFVLVVGVFLVFWGLLVLGVFFSFGCRVTCFLYYTSCLGLMLFGVFFFLFFCSWWHWVFVLLGFLGWGVSLYVLVELVFAWLLLCLWFGLDCFIPWGVCGCCFGFVVFRGGFCCWGGFVFGWGGCFFVVYWGFRCLCGLFLVYDETVRGLLGCVGFGSGPGGGGVVGGWGGLVVGGCVFVFFGGVGFFCCLFLKWVHMGVVFFL